MKPSLEPIDRQNCGRKLAEIRRELGDMSREVLAKLLGVSRSTIMRIEDGRTLPSDEFLSKLRAFHELGVLWWKNLAERDRPGFARLLDELGVDEKTAREFFKGDTVKKFSLMGVVTGLGTIGMLSAGMRASLSLPLPLLLGYGIARGIKSILEANALRCTEVDGRWEIVRIKKVQSADKTKEGDDEE